NTVAVVVPSPASSEALEATSLTIWAPMFSNLSFSSISFATDTPSLVTVGAPKDLSRTTLRPLGPSVVLTASARIFTPFSIRCRASSPNRTSFAAMITFPQYSSLMEWLGSVAYSAYLLNNGFNVALAEDDQLLAVNFDGVAARVFAEHNHIAHFHIYCTYF